MENPLGKRRVQRRSFQIITSVFFKKKRKTQAKKKRSHRRHGFSSLTWTGRQGNADEKQTGTPS
jgi:hypothetical protein